MSTPTEHTASQFGAGGTTDSHVSSFAVLAEARVRIMPVEPLADPEPIPDAKESLTSDQLREIAKRNPPPTQWFEEVEEQLF